MDELQIACIIFHFNLQKVDNKNRSEKLKSLDPLLEYICFESLASLKT